MAKGNTAEKPQGDNLIDFIAAYDRAVQLDPETGAIIEHKEPFTIDDASKMAWYTKKQSDYAAEIMALKAQMEGVVAHYQSLIGQIEHRSERFEAYLGAQAEAFAKANLPDGTKTYKTPWAECPFRTQPASVSVADAAKAQEYLEAFHEGMGVEKTVVVKVKISEVAKSVKDELISDPKSAEALGFTVTPEREMFKVNPLVSKAAKKGEDA